MPANTTDFNFASLKNLRGIGKSAHVLSPYTSWRVGGAAEFFYQPKDADDLVCLLQQIPDHMPITWLGSASNVLIRDGGIKGLVVYVRGSLAKLRVLDSGILLAGAGLTCARLVQFGINHGMVDMAFLVGIPGTVGGALAMNAGAYGDNIWNHVKAITTIDRRGSIRQRKADEFKAGYRNVHGLESNAWFLAGELHFASDESETGIKQARMAAQQLFTKRRSTQPWRDFSCGSVFRNPPNAYAARLIEDCGLKGKKIGGARVSEKHANFIVNDGTATSADIENLINEVKEAVARVHGIELVLEVKILGGNFLK